MNKRTEERKKSIPPLLYLFFLTPFNSPIGLPTFINLTRVPTKFPFSLEIGLRFTDLPTTVCLVTAVHSECQATQPPPS